MSIKTREIPNVELELKKRGLLAKMMKSYRSIDPKVKEVLPATDKIKSIHDNIGQVGYLTPGYVWVAKKSPFGSIVSINRELFDLTIKYGFLLIMYIATGDKFYEFNLSEIIPEDRKTNFRGNVEMMNFPIRYGVNIVKRAEQAE